MFRLLNLVSKYPLKTFIYSTRKYSSTVRYDLAVIGGGSGGLACAKEAASFGKRVIVLDYVQPSPQGTKWGIGGTCVNVGCIPKKLMHYASLLGESIHDSRFYGWSPTENITNDWKVLSESVQGHVRSLNWSHRLQLKEMNITYLNAKGSFLDSNTIKAVSSNGKEDVIKTAKTVIATGMRPKYPEIAGAREFSITSDDLFWKTEPPGKTLVVGASYVALECAGFLSGLGFETSVMMRSIPLRGFDQQMSELVVKEMENKGTTFIKNTTPESVSKINGSNLLRVDWKSGSNTIESGEYDTVMFAIGRLPETANLGLESTDVTLDSSGFVYGGYQGDQERTSDENIYAIGDVLKNSPELTPAAIKAGKLLARRIFSNSVVQMDYNNVATTVFTPLEYSCVGLAEESAFTEFGEQIEVYHSFYTPLEFSVTKKDSSQCYMKVVTLKTEEEPVLGIHMLGPNAGEVMQGFAVAMRCGLTKETLFGTVGIHPTCAEEMVKLHITKASGLDPRPTGC